MRLGRCPICHAGIQLDALVQDDAGRELLTLLLEADDQLGRALVGYLSLFRPARGDLSNARALRLAQEAMAVGSVADRGRLALALSDTTEAIRAKGGSPLRNHHYLARVLETTTGSAGVPPASCWQDAPGSGSVAGPGSGYGTRRDLSSSPTSQTAKALLALQGLKDSGDD